MQELKCNKCSTGIVETYQRGALINGTRCLGCGYETLAKVCKSVGEVRLFLEGMYDDTNILFQDELASLKLEAHFTGDRSKTEKIKVWKGESR